MSIGGAGVIGSGLWIASGVRGGLDSSAVTACKIMFGSGLAVAAVGIVLILVGKPLVMKNEASSTSSNIFARSARLLVGPGTIGLGGTF